MDVRFTLAPGEKDQATTNDAVNGLETFLADDQKNLKINGKSLPMTPGSLKTTSVDRQTDTQEEEVTGLPLTTKIVLAVVFGLIGIAIIIAIIVICMR